MGSNVSTTLVESDSITLIDVFTEKDPKSAFKAH